ncbi:MAG: hypothetical protein EOO47_22730 [Flavobacterium sp.]|nr:MAG: hypothetical protein EOO47_22730 [Flavobacterium sp.]
MMKIYYKLCLALLISLTYNNLCAQTKAAKPNVIFIVIDDIGTAWLPPYAKNLKPDDVEDVVAKAYQEQQKSKVFDMEKHLEAARTSMPFLGQLAQKGVVFNKAFNSAALCAPSRAGIITGKYSQSWGAYTLTEIEQGGIPKDVQALPSIFQKSGYATALIGKWHLAQKDQNNKQNLDLDHFKSSAAPGDHPLDRGFDYYYGYNGANSTYLGSKDLWENHKTVPSMAEKDFLTDTLSAKAKSFVEKSLASKKPFFLYYAPMTLHGGLTLSPEKYRSKFNTGVPFTDNYAGHLLALDEGIRKLYDALAKAGQIENTLFVLCSDNGSPYPVPPYNAPYKGGKGTGWMGGSHSPLIMVMPGKTKVMYSDDLVSCLDILPTALDVAGLEVPKNLDGVSLKKLILEGKQAKPHQILFSSGLNSARWSYNYYDQALGKLLDNDYCPAYLNAISDTYFSIQLTPVKPNQYVKMPNGFPYENLLFNYTKDPLSVTPLKTDADLALKAKAWLNNMASPLKDQKEENKILRTQPIQR